MKEFKPNPISIKDNEKIIDIMQLDYNHHDKGFFLKIIDTKRNVVFHDEVDDNFLLSLDVSIGEITLTYLELDNETIIKDYKIDLLKKYKNIEMDKGVKDKETLFKEISLNVKYKMDSPEGTQKEVELHTEMLNKTTLNNKARLYVEQKIKNIVETYNSLTDEEVMVYTKEIYSKFYGMGILQELDDDIEVGEILVNAYTYPKFRSDIYYYKDGIKYVYDKEFENFDNLLNVYSRSIAFSKKELNNVDNAIIEATRANRDRVNVTIPDASESYVLNIRKFSNFIPDFETMKKSGTIDDFIESLLEVVVQGKANIGIGGEMGTGKTTFINYMLTKTEPLERKVIIASVNETDIDRVLKGHDVVIYNVDDSKGFTFQRLLRTSLRSTASRVIVPESRGSEFKQVYEANLKTKGNMFTAHALDDYSFLDMCVDMYIGDSSITNIDNIRDKIAKSLGIIIIMKKVGNKIRIKSISEIVLDKNNKFERMNLLCYWDFDKEDITKGCYKRTNNRLTPEFKNKLNEYGVPMSKLEAF